MNWEALGRGAVAAFWGRGKGEDSVQEVDRQVEDIGESPAQIGFDFTNIR